MPDYYYYYYYYCCYNNYNYLSSLLPIFARFFQCHYHTTTVPCCACGLVHATLLDHFALTGALSVFVSKNGTVVPKNGASVSQKMGCFCVQKWGFSGLHRDGTICPHAHPLRHAGEPDEQCPSPTAQSVAPAPWVRTRALRNKRSTERTRVTSRAGWFTGRNSRSFCTRCMLRMLVRSRPPVSTACRRFSLGNQRQPPLTTATVFTVTTANHHPRARLLPSPRTSPPIRSPAASSS